MPDSNSNSNSSSSSNNSNNSSSSNIGYSRVNVGTSFGFFEGSTLFWLSCVLGMDMAEGGRKMGSRAPN